MSTGYTAGIVDGKIKTFKEFAILCMRAFGATIHMKEDLMDAEYKAIVPGDYYVNGIKEHKKEILDFTKMSDEKIIELRKKELLKDKEYHLNHIKSSKETRQRLEGILVKAREYHPPTNEHNGIKEFMIEQLTGTISYDGTWKYHDDKLAQIELELSDLNADEIRKAKIDEARKNLEYDLAEHAKEVERCNDSNKWVEDFLKSLA